MLQNSPVQRPNGSNPTIGQPSSLLVTRLRELNITFKPQCKDNRTADYYICIRIYFKKCFHNDYISFPLAFRWNFKARMPFKYIKEIRWRGTDWITGLHPRPGLGVCSQPAIQWVPKAPSLRKWQEPEAADHSPSLDTGVTTSWLGVQYRDILALVIQHTTTEQVSWIVWRQKTQSANKSG